MGKILMIAGNKVFWLKCVPLDENKLTYGLTKNGDFFKNNVLNVALMSLFLHGSVLFNLMEFCALHSVFQWKLLTINYVNEYNITK